MKSKKKPKVKTKITVSDYIKAVKKANREIELKENIGWKSITSVHTNKKIYNRKKLKSSNED